MEQRITSLLLPAPEVELEASCKELDEKVTWLLHNGRKMDNYLELEPFSKDVRLCAHVCDTLKSLPETPTLAAYKDYKAIIILLGISTTHYAILDELAEQHRKRDDIPELTAYCDALHWMRPGRQYLCNVYNTVCHAFHLLRRNPVRDNRLLVTEKELRHAERMLPARSPSPETYIPHLPRPRAVPGRLRKILPCPNSPKGRAMRRTMNRCYTWRKCLHKLLLPIIPLLPYCCNF